MIPPEIAEEVRGHFEDLSGWLALTLEKGAALGQLRLQGGGGRGQGLHVIGAWRDAGRARFGDAATFAALARLAIARVSAAT